MELGFEYRCNRLAVVSVTLRDAWQLTSKSKWCATVSAYCLPFWGQRGVSQTLLFWAGLTHTSGAWLAIGWSRLVFSGATEVTQFCSTGLSPLSRLPWACSRGNDKVEENKRNHTGPLRPGRELAHGHFYWSNQVTWSNSSKESRGSFMEGTIKLCRKG